MNTATAHRIDVSALETLFTALEGAGFKVGPAGRARALTLLTELVADDMLPEDGVALADWLTPIFVTRGVDRARLHDAVARWSDSAKRVEAPSETPPPKAEPRAPWRAQSEPETRAPAPAAQGSIWGARLIAFAKAWRRRAVIAAASLIVVLGLWLSGAPQLLWNALQSTLRPAPTESNAERPMTPAPQAAPAQPIEAPKPPIETDAPSDLEALVAEIDFRAKPFGYAPTLRELARPAEDFIGEVDVPPLTKWDVPTIADELAFPADYPLPLHRVELLRRLIEAKGLTAPTRAEEQRLKETSADFGPQGFRSIASAASEGAASVARDIETVENLAARAGAQRLRTLGCAMGDRSERTKALCQILDGDDFERDARSATLLGDAKGWLRLADFDRDHVAHVRGAFGLIDFQRMQTETRTVRELADDARQSFVGARLQSSSDAEIARAWAMYAFDIGAPLNLSDPPWKPETRQPFWDQHGRGFKGYLFGFGAALAFGAWLAAALNTRAYLARRKPDDPSRVADLAAEDRAKAERADQPIRLAARRMLERSQSTHQIDLRATVEATARAGGFFTPINRPGKRIPEYLFLIDMRSRADHDAKRALQYVERLRAENVKVDAYFFERAPDRVRETPTSPLVPLETIVSTHATKRLVIVGDAAAMLSEGGKDVGAWAQTIGAWTERAVMTTVPADEWGKEEEKLASALGALVRPLSTAALAALPAQLRDEEGDGERAVLPDHDLADHPLPAALRASPHRWLSDEPVEPETLDDMLSELRAYLGISGFRWLSACAIYPAIEWDLTMALGWRLKEAAGDGLATESRVALMSELPWMRAGQMPDWLRSRLINDLASDDRQIVRAFIAEMLDAARSDAAKPNDQIALSFSVEGRRGREAYDDDVFVSFLLGDRDTRDQRTLDASKTVRRLLLPPLHARLFRPHELGVLGSGLLLALGVMASAPLLTDGPKQLSAWAGAVAAIAAPLAFLALRWPIGAAAREVWHALRDPIARVREVVAAPATAIIESRQRRGAFFRRQFILVISWAIATGLSHLIFAALLLLIVGAPTARAGLAALGQWSNVGAGSTALFSFGASVTLLVAYGVLFGASMIGIRASRFLATHIGSPHFAGAPVNLSTAATLLAGALLVQFSVEPALVLLGGVDVRSPETPIEFFGWMALAGLAFQSALLLGLAGFFYRRAHKAVKSEARAGQKTKASANKIAVST